MNGSPPQQLHERTIWLCWRYEKRTDSSGESYQTKIPIDPVTGARGDATDPDTWTTYENALDYANSSAMVEGIGFAFPEDDLLCGIDLDDVVDPDTGEIVYEWASELVDNVDSYTEYSPSGTGLHIIVFAIKPGERCRTKLDDGATEIEMYDEDRFFTYTGDHTGGTPETINQRNDELNAVYYEYLEDDHAGAESGADKNEIDMPDLDLDDEEILEKARNAKNSEKFRRLEQGVDSMHGGDTSAADQAFCNYLAFWTGGDRQQMDRLFRGSGRMREKWDADRGEQTYGELTIDQALSSATEFYSPNGSSSSDQDETQISTTDDFDDEGEWEWEWSHVFDAYADSDTSTREARDMAILGFRQTHTFATFRDTGELYSYNNETGIYEPNGDTVVRSVTESTLESFYSQNEANEILHRITSGSYRDRRAFGADERDPKVCLNNGVLSLPDGEFTDHSPDHLFLQHAPVDWDPEADCPNFDAFLDEILESDEDKQLIYEMLGYCLYPGYPFAKSLFMYGDGSNGKSTLLDVFERILGVENVSSRGLVELEENRFAVADLYRSYANICGDLPDKAVEHTGTFKKLTGGDLVTGEEKFNDPYSFRNTAKLIFSANDPPNISDESNAMYRRLLLLNFPTEFTDPGKPGPDKREQSELLAEIASPEELSGILNRAVDALVGVFDRGGFGQSDSTEDVREQYKRASNPVYAFCNTCLQNDQEGQIEKQELYTIYNRWARETGAPTKDHSVFARELYQHTDAQKGRVGGRGNRQQVYLYISLTSRGEQFTDDADSDGDASQGRLS